MPVSDIPEFVYGNPELVIALGFVLAAIVRWMRGLSYRETVALELLKAKILSIDAVDAWFASRGRPLAREAHADDFVTTLDAVPREILNQVRPPFQPNLTSTAKYRVRDHGIQWAHSQWAARYDYDGEEWQTHLILFTHGTTTDVYVHVEPSVVDPEAHTEGKQLPGDAHSKFDEAWHGD